MEEVRQRGEKTFNAEGEEEEEIDAERKSKNVYASADVIRSLGLGR